MKFGICINENYDIVKNGGYDFVEVALAFVHAMTDEEFKELSETLKENNIKAEAANLFLPAGFNVIGKNVDFAKIEDYTEKAFERLSQLGGKVVVFGSGRQRAIPDDMSHAEGEDVFCKVLKVVGDIASKYDITVVIEPLNIYDCNLVNTVEDAAKICERVNHTNIAILADFYHMYKNGEDTNTILNVGKYLKHVHLARKNDDRKLPYEDKDYDDCLLFAQNLKKIGYNERISLEANFEDDFAKDIKDVWKYLDLFKN